MVYLPNPTQIKSGGGVASPAVPAALIAQYNTAQALRDAAAAAAAATTTLSAPTITVPPPPPIKQKPPSLPMLPPPETTLDSTPVTLSTPITVPTTTTLTSGTVAYVDTTPIIPTPIKQPPPAAPIVAPSTATIAFYESIGYNETNYPTTLASSTIAGGIAATQPVAKPTTLTSGTVARGVDAPSTTITVVNQVVDFTPTPIKQPPPKAPIVAPTGSSTLTDPAATTIPSSVITTANYPVVSKLDMITSTTTSSLAVNSPYLSTSASSSTDLMPLMGGVAVVLLLFLMKK